MPSLVGSEMCIRDRTWGAHDAGGALDESLLLITRAVKVLAEPPESGRLNGGSSGRFHLSQKNPEEPSSLVLVPIPFPHPFPASFDSLRRGKEKQPWSFCSASHLPCQAPEPRILSPCCAVPSPQFCAVRGSPFQRLPSFPVRITLISTMSSIQIPARLSAR